ncbi:hypothetical protein Q4Q35_05420 [Flavivirga aquimarina]|uniref:Uncharacterized protein n=1 Tax=Flavivirga aquimarina TaxID=2027862 RepID=A0ABT8W829_9FLAO|nr:hypothetical protein [Flavivirga aquimarina]MDO5969241.1 hypothetical protein [Flavivirga aquimarina]
MNKQYELDNGWIVKQEGDNPPILYVTPIANTVFKKKIKVEIDETVFKDIVFGERSTKELFKKYKLHTIIIEQGSIKVKPISISKNSSNTYYGKDFILTIENDKFFIEYQLSIQGGGSRKFEINHEVYLEAIKGNYTTFGLFKKYNLHHLDTPENDVK